ncbi:Rieske 2Fe-2S domain-containing protein [Imbroritus primus]|jgi:phenylpropionate dioxygenase-like ring-hydroxylating dioxygenase large terminal subunit|uniref:Rieske 2Fe-2S domain-containing protein n=1 Tax=Imbroritus primus TaxID=3058603 RepID=A0ACD3SSH0_9BURK|nr:Rieske 2Fe-2S domain-containing protein [Burkholderiaceae bacterium PBA]
MSKFEYVRNTWYPVGFSHEFKAGDLQGLKVADKPIVIWRTAEGEVVAFDDRCCHKRFPLSESKLLDDGRLECAYHGLCYDSSGKCVEIPSQPDKAIPPQARLHTVPIKEQDGVVWLWPGDVEQASTLNPPRTPELTDTSCVTAVSPERIEAPANYLLLIENLLDISHFYPLHDGNIGDKANSLIPVELDEGVSEGYEYIKTIRRVDGYEQPPFLREWFLYDVVERLHTHAMISPGMCRVKMHVAPSGQLGTEAERGYTLLHLFYPVDARNLVWRWTCTTKKEHRPLSDPDTPTALKVAEMFPSVVAQDQWALERQQNMFDYPDDDYSEVFLKSDKALRRARQILMGLQRQERAAAEQRTQKVQVIPVSAAQQ